MSLNLQDALSRAALCQVCGWWAVQSAMACLAHRIFAPQHILACHRILTLEVIQEARQRQIQVEYATARALDGTAKKELNFPEAQLLSMLHICSVKLFKRNACVFLGRICCLILREIPIIGFAFLGLNRVALDSLHFCAQHNTLTC